MTTIINGPNPPAERATLVESPDSSAGWVVAVIILLAVIGFGAYYYMHYRAATPNSANINVTIPQLGDTKNNTTNNDTNTTNP
jgi:hypothetical protein